MSKNHIYIAAKYGQIFEMQRVRDRLVQEGHVVTAQWIDGNESSMSQEAAAVMDMEDVKRADTVLSFSNPKGQLNTGGGRHVEFGLGLALGKRMLVVGPKGEHIFHHMPGVQFFDTLEEAVRVLG
jgi:hypothetical protein